MQCQNSRFFKFHDQRSEKAMEHRRREEAQVPDRRFFRPVEDFREVGSGDEYSNLFGESTSVARTRLKAWRAQYEKENENVELPYERTNIVFRATPNWFVRLMMGIREQGGLQSYKIPIAICMTIPLVALIYAKWSTHDFRKGEGRPTRDIQ
jgi:hypothetical protein